MYELLRRSFERFWAHQPEKLVAAPNRSNSSPLILHVREKRLRLPQDVRGCSSILAISHERHRRLKHFRHNTWKAIALCAALRLIVSAFGLGFVEATPSLAAQDMPSQPIAQECTP